MPTMLPAIARVASRRRRFRLCRVIVALAIYRAVRRAYQLGDALADLGDHLLRK